MASKRDDRKVGWIGAALTASLGLVFCCTVWGDGLGTASRNALFWLRGEIDVSSEPVVIVAMDSDSMDVLDQRSDRAWNRSLHAELLMRLKAAGARVVAFDVFFQGGTPEDPRVLQAAAEHGAVYFGGWTDVLKTPSGEPVGRRVWQPFDAAVPLDRVGLVEGALTEVFERHQQEDLGVPSLAWRVAEATVDYLPPSDTERWINYYGKPPTVERVSFWRVLSNSVPANVGLDFADAVVFVGAVVPMGTTGGKGTDNFMTPWGEMIPGVELNATVYLNLLRKDWLKRFDDWLESALVLLGGVALGYGLTRLRPLRAALVSVAVVVGVVFLAWLCFGYLDAWFAWLVVCGVQVPAALGWSVLFYSRRLDLQKGVLEEEKVALERRLATALSAVHAEPSGPVIPDMTLLRCVGKGAYGEVWLGKDVVGNFRAVKIIHRATFSSDVPFEREFKGIERYSPLSRSHPGWVDVLHVGRNEQKGYFFYIMEPADDIRLGQAIEPERYEPKTLSAELERRGRFTMLECLDLSLALASALDHLHRHGLVHRDIKPPNVIFVNGLPKFTDIGLITETAGTQENVSWIGTEGYMPPEGPGAPAADVYGLGKLIYEVGMGRDRRAFPELPTAVLDSDPDEGWDELNAIIMTACETDVSKRFQSAAALHAELLRLYSKLKNGGGARE